MKHSHDEKISRTSGSNHLDIFLPIKFLKKSQNNFTEDCVSKLVPLSIADAATTSASSGHVMRVLLDDLLAAASTQGAIVTHN